MNGLNKVKEIPLQNLQEILKSTKSTRIKYTINNFINANKPIEDLPSH